MHIKRILVLILVIGLIFMGSFSFYIYKVMFISNTSFEVDSIDLYIKTGTSYDQLLEQMDSYLLDIENFNLLAKRKKYNVRPGRYLIRNGMNNNDIINSLRSKNITVNITFNNVKNLNDLAGKISNQNRPFI